MRYGFVMPTGDARVAADLAHEAEQAGWDGFFVWEPVWGVDAWVCLTAAAMRTERIRLGTMITPLSRMRPWDLSGKSATLDVLSGGRVTISVGLGAPDTGFDSFGEVTDRKARAELLDEGLDVVTGLWRGQPYSYDGKHYHITPTEFAPAPMPVQQPIPIWVVGAWPYKKSMERALKYEGLIPSARGENGEMHQATPEELRTIIAHIEQHREGGMTGYDIAVEGTTSTSDKARAVEKVQPWVDAGATWYLEARWGTEGDDVIDQLRRRIVAGPPRP